MNSADSTGTRLNKFLASCGVGSRRACDQMIQDGLVIVNGAVETNPAIRVSNDDFVKIDGKRVQSLETETILLNKPRGLVCSKNDELDRDTIYALIPPKFQHLNHVGRLDKESEGLLILTNDGKLAQSLTHPSKKIEKEYVVTVDQAFNNELLNQFLKGIHTPEGKAQAKSVRRLSPRRVRIVLETGLKRQIRMMFQAVHIKVKKLVRIRIGCLVGEGLEPGKHKVLEQEDIDQLFETPTNDPRVTSLQSQQERRGVKKKSSKKWTRPVSRSHDGISASDRPKRKLAKKVAKKTTKKAGRNFSGSKPTNFKSKGKSLPKRNASRRKK